MCAKLRFKSSELYSRQSLLPGYSQRTVERANIMIIGAGGLGCEMARPSVRLGYRSVTIFDEDIVSVSNLARQFYYAEDVGKNKAKCLVKNLKPHCVGKTRLYAVPFHLNVSIAQHLENLPTPSAILCGVDNNAGRRCASVVARRFNVPLISCGVCFEAESFSVSVQRPGQACLGCIDPSVVKDVRAPCAVASAIDINAIAAGCCIYALSSVLDNGRPLSWNYRKIHLGGFAPDVKRFVKKQQTCPLCVSPCHANKECVS